MNGHERLRVSMKARTDKMKRMEGRKKLRISYFSSVLSMQVALIFVRVCS
jgi:hypothetical protein